MTPRRRRERLDFDRAAQAFAAISEPTRLAILRALAAGPMRPKAVGRILDLPNNALGYHLRVLRLSRVVTAGHWAASVTYEADRAVLEGLSALLGDLTPR